jgi:hypothetical protein
VLEIRDCIFKDENEDEEAVSKAESGNRRQKAKKFRASSRYTVSIKTVAVKPGRDEGWIAADETRASRGCAKGGCG